MLYIGLIVRPDSPKELNTVMTTDEKLAFIWNLKFNDALGCGMSEAQADAFAKKALDELRASLASKRTAAVRWVDAAPNRFARS